MKKILILITAVFALVACSERDFKDSQMGDGNGALVLDAQAEGSFITKAGNQPTIADFKIVIKNADGSVWKTWEKYGEGIVVDQMPAGNYTIEALYGDNLSAAWESPFYFVSKGFSINVGETTDVALVATLFNSKITLTYDSKVISDIEDIEVVVTARVDGILIYTPAITKAGYFAVPSNGVVMAMVTGTRKSNGEELQQKIEISNFAAAQWHKLTISIKSTAGGGSVSLEIDQTLIEKEQDIVIPDHDDITGGGDKPDPDPDVVAPTIVGASYNGVAFDINNALTVVATESTVLDVLISAESGIEKLLVKIDSPSLPQGDLEGMGLGGVFDIATPGVAEEGLTELGLYDPANPIKGKKAHTFSVGSFMGMLYGVGGGGKTHKFELEVVDAKGNIAKKVLVINLAE